MLKKIIRKKGVFIIASSLCIFLLTFFLFNESLFKKTPYASVPLIYREKSVLPYVNIEIEDKTYAVLVDLGADMIMSLRDDILRNLKKKPFEDIEWVDVKGETYTSARYILPKFKLGVIKIFDATARAYSSQMINESGHLFGINSYTIEGALVSYGALGRNFFKIDNVLFDFPNKKFYEVRDFKALGKEGYFLEKMLEVPFTMTKWGITIAIDTDLGIKNLFVDTGATHIFLKSSLAEGFQKEDRSDIEEGVQTYISSKFSFANHDFGQTEIFLYDIKCDQEGPIQIDGCLGMEFLQNYTLVIDWEKSKLFLGTSPSLSACLQSAHSS